MPSFWGGFGQGFAKGFEKSWDTAAQEDKEKKARSRARKARADRLMATIRGRRPSTFEEARYGTPETRDLDKMHIPIDAKHAKQEALAGLPSGKKVSRRELADLEAMESELSRAREDVRDAQRTEEIIRAEERGVERQIALENRREKTAKDKEKRDFEDWEKKRGIERGEITQKDTLGRVRQLAASSATAGMNQGQMQLDLAKLGFSVADPEVYREAMQSFKHASNLLAGKDNQAQRAAITAAKQDYIAAYASLNDASSSPLDWKGFLEIHPAGGFDNVPAGETIFSTSRVTKKVGEEAFDRGLDQADKAAQRAVDRAGDAFVSSPAGKRLRNVIDATLPKAEGDLKMIPVRGGKYKELIDSGLLTQTEAGIFATEDYLKQVADKGELALDYIGMTGELPDPNASKLELQEGLIDALQKSEEVAFQAEELSRIKANESRDEMGYPTIDPVSTAKEYIDGLGITDRQKRAAMLSFTKKHYDGVKNLAARDKTRLDAWEYFSRYADTEGIPLHKGLPKFIIMAEQVYNKDANKWTIVPKLRKHPELQGELTPEDLPIYLQKIKDYQLAGTPIAMDGTIEIEGKGGEKMNVEVTEVPDDLKIPSPNDVGMARPADYDGDVNPSSTRLVKRKAEGKYEKKLKDSGMFTESEIRQKVEHLNRWLWEKK